METINQFSIHYDFPPKKIRPAARGLVICDGKVLLTYEKNTDIYMSPGGGKEADEGFEECCIREIKEESGYDVKITAPFAVINEYCFETCYEAHYFICEITGKGEAQLTSSEIEHGVEPRWLPINEAIEIFSSYGEKAEDHGSLYRREFTILNKYLDEEKRRALCEAFLGKTVDIKIDRPIGFVHKKGNYSMTYPVNYGFIPEVFSADGEELDVYLLGVTEPVKEYTAKVIAIIHRHDDNEDKLVAVPENVTLTKEEIMVAVHFQEQYFDSEIEGL